MLREMYFYIFPVNIIGNLAIKNFLDMNPIQVVLDFSIVLYIITMCYSYGNEVCDCIELVKSLNQSCIT
jgi:hypothetical protein